MNKYSIKTPPINQKLANLFSKVNTIKKKSKSKKKKTFLRAILTNLNFDTCIKIDLKIVFQISKLFWKLKKKMKALTIVFVLLFSKIQGERFPSCL